MSFARRVTVSPTTDGSGDATAVTELLNGRVLNVIYTKDGVAPYAAGVDFLVTLPQSGQVVWDEDDVDASKTVAPRQPTHASDGSPSLLAAAGEPVEDYIWAVNEPVQIVISSGGDTKVGEFQVIVG